MAADGLTEAAGRNLGSIITAIAGSRAPVPLPAKRSQWIIQGGIAALRGFTGRHFFASGSALNDRGGDLTLAVSRGAGPVLRALMQRRPVLSLGRVSRGNNPLASFHERLGLEPSDRCNATVSLNGTLVVFGRFAGRAAVVHLPTGENSQAQMARHRQGLALARQELAGTDLVRLLPELLSVGETHLVQSRAEGVFLDPALLSPSQLTAAITAGLEIALALHRLGQERSESGSARLARPELADILRLLEPQDRGFVETAGAALAQRMPSLRLRSVPMHGDLWLGNLGFDDRLSRVTGVIDWEGYDGHGAPLLDAIHLIVMSVAMHRRVPVSTLLPELWLDRDDQLRMLFQRACSLFDVERPRFQWMAIATWLDLIAHGAIEPRPARFDAWLRDIVGAPGAAVGAWLASRRA